GAGVARRATLSPGRRPATASAASRPTSPIAGRPAGPGGPWPRNRGSPRRGCAGASAAEDVLAEPLPGAADAGLAIDAGLVAQHLLGQVVRREVAVDLTRPLGPV